MTDPLAAPTSRDASTPLGGAPRCFRRPSGRRWKLRGTRRRNRTGLLTPRAAVSQGPGQGARHTSQDILRSSAHFCTSKRVRWLVGGNSQCWSVVKPHDSAKPTGESVMAEATKRATTSRVEGDLDAQSPAADLVRVYLNGIGKTALLTAADEVELAKRIEAGLYAEHLLETRKRLGENRKRDLTAVVRDGQ